ncbi:hypothetical protein RIR_jg1788.t1 [Rhizophagus irregularis DAOM 181602=DAOM 197198]|nr:hypothetical protein RIR_jg1788.t1 [Rhizophagus irregularis DAOM 181602=DAOM 197198]CAB4480162.1 unnamed protein product [Rhizophagus irregularis]CAB5204138.1 unnamed protein product [Rhizophagus irregularis]
MTTLEELSFISLTRQGSFFVKEGEKIMMLHKFTENNRKENERYHVFSGSGKHILFGNHAKKKISKLGAITS